MMRCIEVMSEAFGVLQRKIEKLEKELKEMKGCPASAGNAGKTTLIKTKYPHMSIITH